MQFHFMKIISRATEYAHFSAYLSTLRCVGMLLVRLKVSVRLPTL